MIAGIAAIFAAIADHKNDLSPRLVTLGEVERRPQYGVVQNVGFLCWRIDRGSRGINWHAIHHRPLRAQRATGNRRPVIPSSGIRQATESGRQLFSDGGPSRELADDIAVAVNRNPIELAEYTFES